MTRIPVVGPVVILSLACALSWFVAYLDSPPFSRRVRKQELPSPPVLLFPARACATAVSAVVRVAEGTAKMAVAHGGPDKRPRTVCDNLPVPPFIAFTRLQCYFTSRRLLACGAPGPCLK